MNVLVSGSSRGLGRSIILEYAKNGYDVVINYNNSKPDSNICQLWLLKKMDFFK